MIYDLLRWLQNHGYGLILALFMTINVILLSRVNLLTVIVILHLDCLWSFLIKYFDIACTKISTYNVNLKLRYVSFVYHRFTLLNFRNEELSIFFFAFFPSYVSILKFWICPFSFKIVDTKYTGCDACKERLCCSSIRSDYEKSQITVKNQRDR